MPVYSSKVRDFPTLGNTTTPGDSSADQDWVTNPDGTQARTGEDDVWRRDSDSGASTNFYTQDVGSTWEKTSRGDDPTHASRPGGYYRQGNDPRNYQYGRDPGAADEAAERAWGTGTRANQVGSNIYATGQQNAQEAANRQALEADWLRQNQALGKANVYGSYLAGLEATEGPSAAQAQLQQGTNAALANQMSAARSGRGFGGGAASAGLAQQGLAQTQANQTNQAAALRAQENAAWRQRQAGNLGQAANIQQGLGAQFGRQQEFDVQGGYQNRSINDQAALNWAQQGSDAYFKGAQTDLAGQGVATGIRGQEMEGGLNFEDNILRYWAAENGKELAGQQRSDQKQSAWLNAGATAGGAVLDYLNPTRSDVRSKTRIVPDDTAGIAFAREFPGDEAPRRGEALTEGERSRVRRSLDDFGGDSVFDGTLYRPRGGEALTPGERSRVRMSLEDMPTGEPRTVTTGGAAVEVKQPDFEALDAARNAPGSYYDYKDPSAPGADGARHYGPMAQDLAKTPAGATTVTKMPDGKLGVDTGRLSLVNTAAVSAQQKQIESMAAQLEALLGKQRQGGELAEYGYR